ncbi:MAG: hypothetical protein ABL958_13065 [Bdellovibrionia bacterium]
MGQGRRLAFFIYVWFALALAISVSGLIQFVPGPLMPPLVFGQLAVFLAFTLWPKESRAHIRGLNMRWLTMFHLWRLLPACAFLILYNFGMLPGSFALTAGIGDLIIAVWAPLVAERLELGNPKVLASFHILGLFDLLLVLSRGIPLLMAGDEQMQLMTQFPLSLLPLCLVPLTLGMHAIALYAIARSGLLFRAQ